MKVICDSFERSFVHGLAEEAGLRHESVGDGRKVRLLGSAAAVCLPPFILTYTSNGALQKRLKKEDLRVYYNTLFVCKYFIA